MKALRVNTVASDGRAQQNEAIVFAPIDAETGRPYMTDDGTDFAVSITLRAISKEKDRQLIDACTEKVLGPSGIIEKTDFDLLRDERVAYAIVAWRGFIGADNKPLQCIDPCKRALDWGLKNAIVDRASKAEPVEVTAASFSESAVVS